MIFNSCIKGSFPLSFSLFKLSIICTSYFPLIITKFSTEDFCMITIFTVLQSKWGHYLLMGICSLNWPNDWNSSSQESVFCSHFSTSCLPIQFEIHDVISRFVNNCSEPLVMFIWATGDHFTFSCPPFVSIARSWHSHTLWFTLTQTTRLICECVCMPVLVPCRTGWCDCINSFLYILRRGGKGGKLSRYTSWFLG